MRQSTSQRKTRCSNKELRGRLGIPSRSFKAWSDAVVPVFKNLKARPDRGRAFFFRPDFGASETIFRDCAGRPSRPSTCRTVSVRRSHPIRIAIIGSSASRHHGSLQALKRREGTPAHRFVPPAGRCPGFGRDAGSVRLNAKGSHIKKQLRKQKEICESRCRYILIHDDSTLLRRSLDLNRSLTGTKE